MNKQFFPRSTLEKIFPKNRGVKIGRDYATIFFSNLDDLRYSISLNHSAKEIIEIKNTNQEGVFSINVVFKTEYIKSMLTSFNSLVLNFENLKYKEPRRGEIYITDCGSWNPKGTPHVGQLVVWFQALRKIRLQELKNNAIYKKLFMCNDIGQNIMQCLKDIINNNAPGVEEDIQEIIRSGSNNMEVKRRLLTTYYMDLFKEIFKKHNVEYDLILYQSELQKDFIKYMKQYNFDFVVRENMYGEECYTLIANHGDNNKERIYYLYNLPGNFTYYSGNDIMLFIYLNNLYKKAEFKNVVFKGFELYVASDHKSYTSFLKKAIGKKFDTNLYKLSHYPIIKYRNEEGEVVKFSKRNNNIGQKFGFGKNLYDLDLVEKYCLFIDLSDAESHILSENTIATVYRSINDMKFLLEKADYYQTNNSSAVYIMNLIDKSIKNCQVSLLKDIQSVTLQSKCYLCLKIYKAYVKTLI